LENRLNSIKKRNKLIESETENMNLNINAINYKEKLNEKSIELNNHPNSKNEISRIFLKHNSDNSSPFSYKNQENTPKKNHEKFKDKKEDNQKSNAEANLKEHEKSEKIQNRSNKLRDFLKQIKTENKNIYKKEDYEKSK